MRMALLATLLLVIPAPLRGQERIPVQTDFGGGFTFERDRGITTGLIDGPADSVYRSLRAISDQLGLKIKDSEENPAGREFLIKRRRLVRRLGKHPVSRFLSCGEGLTGPNADSWYVYVTLHSKVTPARSGQSRLDLQISADAVDVPGGRNDRVVCSTTGSLEQGIVKRLRLAFVNPR